jgi:predicted MFS family arabinose efflux permease
MKPSKLWYLAQGSVGVVQWVSVSLLLAPIIIQNTGSGGLMGMVIAIIGGFGISAPFIGKLADSYALHRPLQKTALVAHLLALVLLYFSGNGALLYYVIGGLIGFGTVTLMLLNPTFVLSSSHNQQQEGKGLARLYQSQFVGVILAALLVAGLQSLGFTVHTQLIALMSLTGGILVILIVFPPEQVTQMESEQAKVATQASTNAPWWLFLLAVFFSMFLSANLLEMGPVLLEKLFAVQTSSSAIGMAGSALLSIVLLEPAGRWIQRSGPFKVWSCALAAYMVVGVALYLMIGHKVQSFLPVLFMVLLMQACSWSDMSVPAIAARLSPLTPALTQGTLMFAIAGGFAAGTMMAGVSIDQFGFGSVITFSTISMFVSLMFAGALAIKLARR